MKYKVVLTANIIYILTIVNLAKDLRRSTKHYLPPVIKKTLQSAFVTKSVLRSPIL